MSATPHVAPNYDPLPVEISSAEGAWVVDTSGRRCLDLLAGYSALNFGHRHPALLAAAREQLGRVTLTSRAFSHDQLEPFCAELADLAGMQMVLPMNTGAEAVETGIKVARKWAGDVKGLPPGRAVIVVAAGSFHGRTTTIVGFSTDPVARTGFGPFTPGFRIVPFGDSSALAEAMDGDVAAVLIEPIQGEAGIIVPPDGYLRAIRDTCDAHGALMIADEIQSGLGRVGSTFACQREGIVPDAYLLGKALGGGIVPVSAVVSSAEVLGVLTPGTHGSTFGGNPLACAVGRAVVGLLSTGEHQQRAAELGETLAKRLGALVGRGLTAVRSAGLWAGADVDPAIGTGRDVCEALARRGVLVKDTHGATIRLAPPLVIAEDDLLWALDELEAVLVDGPVAKR